MKSDIKTRAVLYARVSSEEQLENYSIHTQLLACQERCDQKGYTPVVAYWDDISGAKIDRPAMSQILDLARHHEFQVLVCYDIDRFVRDFAPLYIYTTELAACGVRIEYVAHDFEDSASGALQQDIHVSFAKYERLKFRERSMRGRAGKARQGKVPMNIRGVCKYGYDYGDGELTLNDAQAAVVIRIFTWYTDEKIGTVEIARRLTEQRIPTGGDAHGGLRSKTSPGHWSANSINRILSDETYIGNYYYQKTITRDGKQYPRPRSEWIHIPVPKIIDEATFYAAQEQRSKNKTSAKRNTKHSYLLQHRLRCTKCGYSCRALHRVSPNGIERYYYACASQSNRWLVDDFAPACKGYVRAELLDAVVWDAIKDFLMQPERIRETLLTQHQADQTETRIDALEKEIAEQKAQQQRLLDLYLSRSDFPLDLLDQRNTSIQSRIDSLTAAHTQLVQSRRPRITKSDVDSIVAAVSKIQRSIQEATFEQKLYVLDLLRVQATLDRDTNIILLEGLFPSVSIDVQSGNTWCTAPAAGNNPARSYRRPRI